jgi:hypothetical protein
MHATGSDLLGIAGERRFATILADPPWQFTNKTGKIAPEHRRLSRYRTLTRTFAQAGRAIRNHRSLQSRPYVELFARGTRKNWSSWGNQADDTSAPTWKTNAHNLLVAAE